MTQWSGQNARPFSVHQWLIIAEVGWSGSRGRSDTRCASRITSVLGLAPWIQEIVPGLIDASSDPPTSTSEYMSHDFSSECECALYSAPLSAHQ